MEKGSTHCEIKRFTRELAQWTRITSPTRTGGLQRTIPIRPSRLHFAGTSRTRTSISQWKDTFANWVFKCSLCAGTLLVGEVQKFQESCLTQMRCSLFMHRLNAIAYQRQNRNVVSLGNCFLSWTVVPRLQPEDWIIWHRLAWLHRRGQRTSWPCSLRNVSHHQPYHSSTGLGHWRQNSRRPPQSRRLPYLGFWLRGDPGSEITLFFDANEVCTEKTWPKIMDEIFLPPFRGYVYADRTHYLNKLDFNPLIPYFGKNLLGSDPSNKNHSIVLNILKELTRIGV